MTHRAIRGGHWTPEQDDMLRRVVGTIPRERLQEAWFEQTGIQRSLDALTVRCKRIDVSMWAQGLSMRDVEALFRFDHRSIEHCWVDSGELKATRWQGRGPNNGWWFNESDLEDFIRAYPWRYDWRRMQPGHRLTRIAELVNRADPWRTYDDLAKFVGISPNNLDRWRRRGLVPHRRRPKGGGYRIVVRGRSFPAIRDAILEARQAARRRAVANVQWRSRGGQQRDAIGRLVAA